MKIKRVFLIVLDSFGIGALPDAANYGDEGSNTLRSCFLQKEFFAPNLEKSGIFNIDGNDYAPKYPHPIGAFGRLKEASNLLPTLNLEL